MVRESSVTIKNFYVNIHESPTFNENMMRTNVLLET